MKDVESPKLSGAFSYIFVGHINWTRASKPRRFATKNDETKHFPIGGEIPTWYLKHPVKNGR